MSCCGSTSMVTMKEGQKAVVTLSYPQSSHQQPSAHKLPVMITISSIPLKCQDVAVM